MEERLGGKMKSLLDSGAKGGRQDSVGMISAIGNLQAKLTDVEAVAWAASQRGAQACDSLEAINDAVRTLEKRIEHNTEAVLERHDLLNEVALRLAEAAARADSRIVDIAGGLAGLDRKAESLRRVGEASMKLLLGRIESLDRALSLLSQEDSRKGASLTEVTRAVSGLGGEMAQIRETAKASADEMLSAMSAWKENLDAMFRSAVLWAETEDLRDAAWHQDQALLKKDVDALRRLVIAEEGQERPAAPASAARLMSLSAVPPESEGETRLVLKSGSVWRVVRKDVSAEKATTAPAFGKSPVNEHKGLDRQDGIRLQGHQVVSSEVLDKGWEGCGWAVGNARLEAGGVVRAIADGEAGFVTRRVPFERGGAFEVEVELIPGSKGGLLPKVSIVTDADEGVGCDVSLDRDTTTFRAFAPGRTRELKFRVVARNCKAGSSFAIRRITVKRIDVDAHQRTVRALVGEPVLASMASIPSRREMLADAVSSLLAQSDRVRVFLNNYPDVPDFLNHPRVDVRRSQDWDDRGDAGKVFWLEHDKEPGYRLIVDDDLIFPPDFAEVMCAKVAAKDRKAIYTSHGVILRQPIQRYYQPQSRSVTFHFAAPLEEDRTVHIATTGCTCFYSDSILMKWSDFKYCNSADIWLTLYAQRENIPVLTPSRPRNWVRENKSTAAIETIYDNSLNQTKSRLDSSLVQDTVLKRSWPLTVKVGGRLKCGLLVAVGTRDALAARIERLIAGSAGGAASGAEWVVMLAYDSRIPASEAAVAGTRIERETHLLDIASGIDALTQAAALMARIGRDAFVAVDGDALAADGAGLPPVVGMPERWRDGTMLKLRLAGRKALAGVVVGGGKIPDGLLRLLPEFSLVPASGEASFAKALRGRKRPVVKAKAIPAPTINTVFKSVKVLNLDRRPDRWKNVSKSLALAGIEAERFCAVDGNLPDVAAEYGRYAAQPKVTVSAQVPAVRYERDLYLNYASQMARIAYVEREGKKAVASRGAWGYLKSYEAILEEALAQGRESLLVFDDDVLLHKDIKTLFAQAMKQLPDDWLILQFGTLQYNWAPPWCEWHSPMLYRTNGSAIGSHAVGMRFDVMPFLLDQVRRFDMPYDIGALSAATRAFPERCFVIHPNLAIQSITDTDIGTSEFQSVRKREEAAATYRWTLDDYR